MPSVLLLFDSCLPVGRSRGGLTERLAQARELGRRVAEFAQRLFP